MNKKETEKSEKETVKGTPESESSVQEAIVPAELIYDEPPEESAFREDPLRKEVPGRYRNVGTFSADIGSEFEISNVSRQEEEDYTFRFMRKCRYNGEILVGTTTVFKKP